MARDIWDIGSAEFGRHVRQLRKSRELTQDELAARSGLASDTVRRMENGGVSPSLNSLLRLSRGLEIRLSTILVGCEEGVVPLDREIVDMLVGRSPEELATLLKVLRVLCKK